MNEATRTLHAAMRALVEEIEPPIREEIEPPIREKIKPRIRSFDAVALLQLFRERNVPPHAIRYRGKPGSSPRPTLLESIEIVGEDGDPDCHILITVNLGLGSCRSPLPAYLVVMLLDERHSAPLRQLVDFIDNRLIGERLRSFRPELEARLVDDKLVVEWDQTRLDMLRLTEKTSPATLHWIFRRVFPEIGVCVRRAPGRQQFEVAEVRLGSGKVGEAAFGGAASVSVFGLTVTLLADEPTTFADQAWTVEARRRLNEQVLPILAGSGLHLTVVLLLFDRAADATFNDESYVDYNPLIGGASGPARIVLFAGPIPEPTSDEPPPGPSAGRPRLREVDD